LLRAVRVQSHNYGETPFFEESDFSGADVPPPEVIGQLEAKIRDVIAMVNLFTPNARFFTMPDAKDSG